MEKVFRTEDVGLRISIPTGILGLGAVNFLINSNSWLDTGKICIP